MTNQEESGNEIIYVPKKDHLDWGLLGAIAFSLGLSGGVMHYVTMDLAEKGAKELTAYVENVDGKKGFSETDLSDFAERAQIDVEMTYDLFQDSSRMNFFKKHDSTSFFFVEYFNPFLGPGFSFFNSKYRLPGIENRGEVALRSYRNEEWRKNR